MQRTRHLLSAGAVLFVLLIFGTLLLNAPSLKASANVDISLFLDQTKITLDTKYVTTGKITGYIQGNTKVQYYVYAVDSNGLVIPQEGYDMDGTTFSLDITARKAGSTTVRVCLAESKSGNIQAEANVSVTVNSYDTSKMKVSIGESKLSLYAGGKTQKTLTITNLPKGLTTTTYWGRESGKATYFGAEWNGKFTTSGTTVTGALDLWGIQAGSDALTLTVKEKNTGTVLCSAKIPVTVYNNLYKLSYTDEYTYDLADGDQFALYSKSYHTMMYPVKIRSSKLDNLTYTKFETDTSNNMWTCLFKPAQTGTYPITLNLYLNQGTEEKENWVQAGAQTYNVTVIDSRKDASLAKQADVIMFDHPGYNATYYTTVPEGAGGDDDWWDDWDYWDDWEDWGIGTDSSGIHIGKPVLLKSEYSADAITSSRNDEEKLKKLNSYAIPVYIDHEFMVPGGPDDLTVHYDSDYVTDASFTKLGDYTMENGTEIYRKYAFRFRVIAPGKTYMRVCRENSLTSEIAEEQTLDLKIIPDGDTTTNGDINNDGTLDVADVVLLQKYLMAVPNTELANWRAGDIDYNERLDAVDLSFLKAMVLEQPQGVG